MEQLQLGDRARCKVTGFSGIVISISTYLNGCIRIGLQPEDLKDGKPIDSGYFDIGQLEVTDKGVHTPVVLHPMPAPVMPASPLIGGPEREGAGFSR